MKHFKYNMFLALLCVCPLASFAQKSEFPDSSNLIDEIKWIRNFNFADKVHSSNSFEKLRLKRLKTHCDFIYLSGHKFSKSSWFERTRKLELSECEKIFDLYSIDKMAPFRTPNRNEISKAKTYEELSFYWTPQEADKAPQRDRKPRWSPPIIWIPENRFATNNQFRPIINGLDKQAKALFDRYQPVSIEEERSLPLNSKIENNINKDRQQSEVKGTIRHLGGVNWDGVKLFPMKVVVQDQKEKIFNVFETDEKGYFSFELPPGEYFLCPQSCDDKVLKLRRTKITAPKGKAIEVNLTFDNGIR